MYCTTVPATKAIATERKMAIITESAFSVFIMSPRLSIPVSSPIIFRIARTNVPPSSSNTIETVVEVGSPNVLNMSSSTTSVTITARKIHIRS